MTISQDVPERKQYVKVELRKVGLQNLVIFPLDTEQVSFHVGWICYMLLRQSFRISIFVIQFVLLIAITVVHQFQQSGRLFISLTEHDDKHCHHYLLDTLS